MTTATRISAGATEAHLLLSTSAPSSSAVPDLFPTPVPTPDLLAWTPLLDPWPGAHDWWWLTVVPLAFGIAMIFKAYRLPALDRYWRHVMVMTMQIVAAMIAFALTLFALALWLLPRLPAE